jgi:predicted nucleotidyltransferase component of viral defense system
MRLHENIPLFRQSIQFAAQQKKILDIYIEKDYWVLYALHAIYSSEMSKETVFKGGTALAKCFGLIERFSEDIDLVVLRNEGESNNNLTNKIKKISSIVSNILPEVTITEVTQKMGMNRKTAHTYNKEFNGNYGQVRDVVIVEATWLGYFEPYTTKPVNTYIYEMMEKTGQLAIANEYDLLPFDVLVLAPERTLCEKIMSLVRFSYGENAIEDLKKKIRHCYDLHQLLQEKAIADFFESNDFETMLLKVANDDIVSYKNNNNWLQNHPNEAEIFKNIDNVWSVLRTTYNNEFRQLVFGNLPSDALVLDTLKAIKQRLSEIKWTVKIDKTQ